AQSSITINWCLEIVAIVAQSLGFSAALVPIFRHYHVFVTPIIRVIVTQNSRTSRPAAGHTDVP
ncbi:hypothetical protein BaRGS_00016427, partial [Batillaria attramentaria]